MLRIERETFSPGVVRKVVLAAVETKSFARAEVVMRSIGEVEISGRHIGRLAQAHGQQLIDQQRQRAQAHDRKQLAVEVANAPDLAVVELDGGRLRTREPDHGPGTHEPAWKETKNALFLRMSSVVHAVDPHPELPDSLQKRGRVRRLVREMSGSAAVGEDSLDEDREASDEASAVSEDHGPKTLLRTCLSSLDDVHTFGPLMAAEAHRKAFFQARRRAFVADGMKCNWTVWQRHFPTFTPIVDFLHVVSHVYHVAVATGGDEDFGWGRCLEWIEAIWQGRVEEVLAQLTQWLAEQPSPESADESVPEDDPRRIARSTWTYLANNRGRMNYPEYRRWGLPITSSLMESLVKEIHWRVKGTEKFWNNPDGATPILALKAAALSEDDRLLRLLQ